MGLFIIGFMIVGIIFMVVGMRVVLVGWFSHFFGFYYILLCLQQLNNKKILIYIFINKWVINILSNLNKKG